MRPSIVEIAAGNSSFSTLVTAVKAAGLAETLSGKGPFTVFAIGRSEHRRRQYRRGQSPERQSQRQ
jgi:Fasciclin domain